jgi:hypothetical protein
MAAGVTGVKVDEVFKLNEAAKQLSVFAGEPDIAGAAHDDA